MLYPRVPSEIFLILGVLICSLTTFISTAPASDGKSSNMDFYNMQTPNENRQPGTNTQDEDVLELDHLKSPHNLNYQQGEILPALERQLETDTDSSSMGRQEDEAIQRENEQNNLHDKEQEENYNNSLLKSFHGAARLTFGQNPESSAEYLLRHSGGQYSSLDMAQYVFWTGDEEGVARAVEEFIQKGLMSRENAIKFLRDISMGIEYLENSYSNHPQADQSTGHSVTQEITTTTQKPKTEKNIHTKPTISPAIQKAIKNLPSLLKLNEITNERNKENIVDYDEINGRLRLADFLYAEYSLEEVIYQLAKVMFSQSLTRGSEQAQTALQRLTAFLESEGASGRISPVLQKKVLDVLLAALSDCLAEHPELLPVARAGLGNAIEQLPKAAVKQNQ